MASDNTCQTITDCLQFDLKNYSLNNGKTYGNPLLSFQVDCPGVATPVTVYVQPNTIRLTWPYQPNSPVPYPPVVLSCPAGGAIIKTISQASTQQQIDDIINGMIFQCAQAQAEAGACIPRNQFNDVVYYSHPCVTGVLVYNGTLPGWITLDQSGKRLIGAAQVFSGVTKAEANLSAQTALNNFGNESVAAGTFKCTTLDWSQLVWVPISNQTANPGGINNNSQTGGLFTDTVFKAAGATFPGNSGYQTVGTLTYTGPAQNCNCQIIVSGVNGDADTTAVFTVLAGVFPLPGTFLVPFVNGTYNFPFHIDAGVAATVQVRLQHISSFGGGTLLLSGGSSWSGIITTL